MVDILIENGANVNLACTNLYTPLHYTLKFNRNTMVQLLLQNGASVMAKDQYGITPMEMSLMKKQIASLKMLNHFTNFPN